MFEHSEDHRDSVPVMAELARPMSRGRFVLYNTLVGLAVGGTGAAVDVEASHDILNGHNVQSNAGLVAFGSTIILAAVGKFGRDAWQAHRTPVEQ